MINLTKRLSAVAELVPPGAVIADIGTDHGYIPIALCESGRCPKAIASDVVPGPLTAAKEHVRRAGLTAKIECRLGSGLETLQPGEVTGALFCGMGGPLIQNLLRQSPGVVEKLEFLIFQPQSDVPVLRRHIYDMAWHIEDERLVEEDGRLYEIILARPGRADVPPRWLCEIGPCNWARHDELVPRLIAELRQKDERVRAGLLRSQKDQSQRLALLDRHINELEELLCQYNSAK